MLLYIVRHGIAIDREEPGCPPDPERFLTEDGIKKTSEAAQGLSALGAGTGLFFSSPYVRAIQTAEIFASVLEFPKLKIRRTDLLLPGADVQTFYRELAKNKAAESVFCFGHAPHLDDLIAAALGAKKNVTQLKKAGVALLELARISPPVGTLVWLVTPKILKKVGK
jgi:phosphohistidine phosphatase